MNVLERYPIVWRNSRKGTYSNTLKPVAASTVIEIKPHLRIKVYRYENFINEDIDILDLKTRAYNALRRNAINTIGNLLDIYDRLPFLHNIGVTALDEIRNKFFDYYVGFLRKNGIEKVEVVDE